MTIIAFFSIRCLCATIAVIDTGADINHPMLQEHLWTNSKEIPDNGIDDDNNGYIDDVHGWNFVDNNNQISDLHGHGTHIAGIIAQNSAESKLMVLKYFDPRLSAQKNLNNTIAAIEYATKMGAQIINYSAGGPGENLREESAIKAAQEQNILLIAASGNDSKNTDINKYYPASYSLSNIMSVMSLNKHKGISQFSNYGPHSVDIAILGEDIVSAAPKNQFAKMSGTSQATAFITAFAGNTIDADKNILAEELKTLLSYSGNPASSLKDKSISERIFDPSLLASMKSSRESAFGQQWTNMIDIPPEQVLVPEP